MNNRQQTARLAKCAVLFFRKRLRKKGGSLRWPSSRFFGRPISPDQSGCYTENIMRILGILLAQALVLSAAQADLKGNWKRHVVWEGLHNNVAVAADFTGDGRVDIISNAGNKTRLFVAPDWKEVIIGDHKDHNFIHGETFDVDGDGDADFIGARYQPGLIVWFEQPDKNAASGPWKARIAEDEIIGIHGVLKADVNGDGKLDLLANSAQPKGKFPDSAVWLEIPENPRLAKRWTRHVFAKNDAPGLSHYLGAGDLNGDGRLDITLAAKGGPSDKSGKGEWFAWWEAGKDPTRPFKKHLLPGKHPGATNILPADVNGDGKLDIVASLGHGTGLIWYENPGWKIHDINTELLSSHCLQVGDIDGDGDIDAATCAYISRKAAWFENDGKGRFTTHIIHDDQAAYDIRLVDMDGDGDLDTLIAGQRSKNVVWLENPLRNP